jgi:hypothetical protein
MRTFSKDINKNTEHKSVFFLTPSDVKNTAFLTFDYSGNDKDDDQWMYLPALKKTKRIPASDKDGAFMGSDFSYADMTSSNPSSAFNKKAFKRSKNNKTSFIYKPFSILRTLNISSSMATLILISRLLKMDLCRVCLPYFVVIVVCVATQIPSIFSILRTAKRKHY